MKRNLINRRGMTLVELIVASALLVIIMAGIFIFLSTGLSLNEKLINRQDDLEKARLASAFITNFLHANDVEGKISFIDDPIDVIVIDNDDGTYTYLFYSDDKEGLIMAIGNEFHQLMNGKVIAQIEDMTVFVESSLDTKLLTIVFTYSNGKELSSYVTLKAS